MNLFFIGSYGAKGEYAFIPVAIGFLMGAVFVYGTDKVISYLGINSTSMMIGELLRLSFTVNLGLIFGSFPCQR
jgi:hypothetical protein